MADAFFIKRIPLKGEGYLILEGLGTRSVLHTYKGAFNITAPAAGATVQNSAPNTFDVTWTTDLLHTLHTVDIAHTADGGLTWTSVVTGTANDGSYTVPAATVALGTECQIRIQSNTDNSIYAISDYYFTTAA